MMDVVNRFEEMQSKKTPSTSAKPTSQANSSREPVPSTSQLAAASKTIYDVSTDDDDDNDAGNQLDEDGLPVLPDFFSGKTFLLSGKFKDRRTLVRYIVAYNGYVRLLLEPICINMIERGVVAGYRAQLSLDYRPNSSLARLRPTVNMLNRLGTGQ